MNTRTVTPAGSEQAATPLRDRLHGMWSAVAPAWDRYADYADERGADGGRRGVGQPRDAPPPAARAAARGRRRRDGQDVRGDRRAHQARMRGSRIM